MSLVYNELISGLALFVADAAEVIESRINDTEGGRAEYYVHYEGCKLASEDNQAASHRKDKFIMCIHCLVLFIRIGTNELTNMNGLINYQEKLNWIKYFTWYIQSEHCTQYFPQGSLCICPANERQRYIVMSSLIGWSHTQNDPCCHSSSRKKKHDKVVWL